MNYRIQVILQNDVFQPCGFKQAKVKRIEVDATEKCQPAAGDSQQAYCEFAWVICVSADCHFLTSTKEPSLREVTMHIPFRRQQNNTYVAILRPNLEQTGQRRG